MSHTGWLINRDPYVMVQKIIPKYNWVPYFIPQNNPTNHGFFHCSSFLSHQCRHIKWRMSVEVRNVSLVSFCWEVWGFCLNFIVCWKWFIVETQVNTVLFGVHYFRSHGIWGSHWSDFFWNSTWRYLKWQMLPLLVLEETTKTEKRSESNAPTLQNGCVFFPPALRRPRSFI